LPNAILSIAFSPLVNGNVFVAIQQNGVGLRIYSLDTTTGAANFLSSLPLANIRSVGYSALINGNLFAAVSQSTSNTVTPFQVNTSTGAFTALTSAATGSFPVSIAFSQLVNNTLLSGLVNTNDNTINIYSVDPSTGLFTNLTAAGSPFSADSAPVGFAFSPLTNQRLFFATSNISSNDISVYKVIYSPLLLSAHINCATGLVTITGSGADTSAIITAFADGVTQIGTGSPDIAGNFNFSTSVPLIGGSHTVTVTQTIGSCTTEQSNSIALSSCASPLVLSTSTLTQAIINKYCPLLSI